MWADQTDKIVECVNAGTKNIEQYCNHRKKYPGNLSKLKELFNDIVDITSFWTGNTSIGHRKEKAIEVAFQNFYNNFYKLLIDFKNLAYSHMIQEEYDVALSCLYQGNIYRYIGHGDCQDSEKLLKVKYNSIWVSWSKEPNNSYLEAKLYGEYIKLYATVENEMYGIDLEPLGVSRSNEREVVFPTIKEMINKEISFRNCDFDYEKYEDNESFVPVQYIKIENNKISVHETDNFKKVLKKAFKSNSFDSRDCLFEADEYIRVFVEELSLFNKPETLYFYQEGEPVEIFCGTVLIAKTGEENFEGLSDENVKQIIDKLIKVDGIYKIYD